MALRTNPRPLHKTLTVSKADKLLCNLLWFGTEPDSLIVERWVNGGSPLLVTEVPTQDKLARKGRRRYTIARFEYDHYKGWGKHQKGQRVYGPVCGDATSFLKFDFDRHTSAVPGKAHCQKVISFLDHLRSYPDLRILPEVDPLNASAALWLFLPRPWPIDKAKVLATRLRTETGFIGEIYPDNCPQVYLPLRPDKLTIIDTGFCPSRILQARDGRDYKVYDTREVMPYLGRTSFPDVEAVNQALAEGILNLPDEEKASSYSASSPRSRKQGPGQMGTVKYKGNFLKNIIDFKNGDIQPDTLGCYTTPIRRLLSVGYGLAHDDIDDIFEDVFAQHDVSYSDRLSTNPGEFWRTETYLINAIEDENGYQDDGEASRAKLEATAKSWTERGIDVVAYLRGQKELRLSQKPTLKLVWTQELLALVPPLAKIAVCDQDQARRLLEIVVSHVEIRNELAISYLGLLMEGIGINASSQEKKHQVRKWFEKHLITKFKNHFHDEDTGYSHGDFFICRLSVRFEEEQLPPVSTLLSFFSSVQEAILERRRLDCEANYRRRIAEYWRLKATKRPAPVLINGRYIPEWLAA